MTEQNVDYSFYKFSKVELLKYSVMGSGYCFIIGIIFYQNIALSLLASLGAIIFVKERRKKQVKERKSELLLGFREAMYALGSSLSAGRAVEQAFAQSLNDLNIIYDVDADIVIEWQLVVHKIRMNETVEVALMDFSNRAHIEDIYNFVSVFVMAKKSGGDLVRIIKDTTKIINEKIEIQKEIDVLITQKKFEQQILSYIIPGMILFFTFTSPGFLEPLYNSFNGRVIMTFALFLYVISGQIGKKIVEIEV